MRAEVLINAAAGVRPGTMGAEAAEIGDRLSSLGVEWGVTRVPGPEMEAAAREAAGRADRVIVGGGDGSIGAAAAALAGGDTPLGILPLGTFNHFARDLGIPTSLDEAVRTAAGGRVRRVDVGEVSGRVFVNNSSIGLYPHAVADRKARRPRGTTAKWAAMGRSAVATLRRLPLARVTLRIPDGSVVLTTPIVFIGNNRYEMSRWAVGSRAALDRGELWVYVVSAGGRLGVLGLAARAFLGRLEQSRDFVGLGLTEVSVEDRRRRIPVALDGEVCNLEPPLKYRIRPGALPVVVPDDTVAAAVAAGGG